MGVDAARTFCAGRPEIGMVLLYPDKQGSSVEVATAGIESGDWRLLD